jgi:hypothetical protein
VEVMLGVEEALDATNGISQTNARRFPIEAMVNSDIELFNN